MIKTAREKYEESIADETLAELLKLAWSRQTEELLGAVAEHFRIVILSRPAYLFLTNTTLCTISS